MARSSRPASGRAEGDRDDARSRWGWLSLGSVVAAPLLLLLAIAATPGPGAGPLALATCPAAVILAIVAGWRSGQGAGDPLSGRVGFVVGIAEAALIGLVVLFSLLAWDQITESL